jgi:hypothetical protein
MLGRRSLEAGEKWGTLVRLTFLNCVPWAAESVSG